MSDHDVAGGRGEAPQSVVEGPLVSRVAALDIAKASLVACVRVPDEARVGRRLQSVREFSTLTPALLVNPRGQRFRGVAAQSQTRQERAGRAKTDRLDAVWLAKLMERGMVRPSLVQPKPIRQLRDLARYRRSVSGPTREVQRLQDLLEDAQIKLSSVISDIMGVSGREMIEALIAGERDPKTLAQMARAGCARRSRSSKRR